MTRKEVIEKIIEFFNDNDDVFIDCIEELDGYNGYFSFDGYANLESSNWKDYSSFNDEYAVESMEENRRYIDTIDNNDDLCELFDMLEECEE